MMTQVLRKKADDINKIARSHGVSRVRVFGSHAVGRRGGLVMWIYWSSS
jgi:predicted nucleotidyltransferase